jgi:DNA-binding transcriptional regulator GbsR (MarR family)
MNIELEKVRDSFIETVGQLSMSLGLSQVVGQLYALLYLSNKPLSLNDMVEILGISKGNVSVNIRELERWGAVRKVWVKGSRRDHYKSESDILKIVLNRLKDGLQRRMNNTMNAIDKMSELINEGKKEFNATDKKTAMIYVERLNEIKELRSVIGDFLENVSEFIPKKG